MFNAAVIINDGSSNATNTRLPKERIDTYEDDWTLKNPNMKTDIFWTGKTIFRYGDDKLSVAAPSKNRPGPQSTSIKAGGKEGGEGAALQTNRKCCTEACWLHDQARESREV